LFRGRLSERTVSVGLGIRGRWHINIVTGAFGFLLAEYQAKIAGGKGHTCVPNVDLGKQDEDAEFWADKHPWRSTRRRGDEPGSSVKDTFRRGLFTLGCKTVGRMACGMDETLLWTSMWMRGTALFGAVGPRSMGVKLYLCIYKLPLGVESGSIQVE